MTDVMEKEEERRGRCGLQDCLRILSKYICTYTSLYALVCMICVRVCTSVQVYVNKCTYM